MWISYSRIDNKQLNHTVKNKIHLRLLNRPEPFSPYEGQHDDPFPISSSGGFSSPSASYVPDEYTPEYRTIHQYTPNHVL